MLTFLLHYLLKYPAGAIFPRLRIKRTLALSLVVGVTPLIVLFPIRSQFADFFYLLSGGRNKQLGYPVPNFQFLWSLSEIFFTGNYTHTYLIPGPMKAILLLTSYSLLGWLAWKQRNP